MPQSSSPSFMVRTRAWGAATCWLCCSAALCQEPPALAATTPEQPSEECTVVITAAPLPYRQFNDIQIAGAMITDPQSQQPEPAQVICHRMVERSHATHLGELLQQLPALLQDPVRDLPGTLHAAVLHGQSAGTLVLLNGQRLPGLGLASGSGSNEVVDLRFLPMSAIDRIEVKTPGASSTLGSDGIMGIVNVITRQTRGVTIGVDSFAPRFGAGQDQGLNLAWGQGSLRRDGYALQMHTAVSRRHPVWLSPVEQTWHEAPPSTRSQWYMDGEWALGAQWTGFGHLLGTRESPHESGERTPEQAWAPSSRQAMHQWRVGLKGPWQSWQMQAWGASGQARQQQLASPPQVVMLDAPTQERPDRQALLQAWPGLDAVPAQGHETGLQTLDLRATRELGETAHGPRTLGLGWHWRRESLATLSSTPDILPWQAQRQQWAVHAQLKTHPAEQQELIASLRHDQYSDVGHAQTGQLAWKWRPVHAFLMRASLGTGFRAPGLEQRSPNLSQRWLIWDTQQQSAVTVQRRGQAELQAEASTQASWGFRLAPHPRWTLGADLWQIDVRRAIGYLGPATLRATGQWVSGVHGPELDSVAQNLGRSHKRGIDYDTEWRVPGDIGLLRLSFKGTHYLKSSLTEVASGQTVSDLAYFSDTTQGATPRHRLVAAASLERAQWVLMSGWRYRSAYREVLDRPLAPGLVGSTDTRRVPAHWQLDVGVQWALGRQLSVGAWLQDLTDRGRAQVLASASAFRGTRLLRQEDLGRSLKLQADYRF